MGTWIPICSNSQQTVKVQLLSLL